MEDSTAVGHGAAASLHAVTCVVRPVEAHHTVPATGHAAAGRAEFLRILGGRDVSIAGDGGFLAEYIDIYSGVEDRILWDKYNSIDPRSANYISDCAAKGYNFDSSYPANVLTVDVSISTRIVAYSFILVSIMSIIIYKVINR